MLGVSRTGRGRENRERQTPDAELHKNIPQKSLESNPPKAKKPKRPQEAKKQKKAEKSERLVVHLNIQDGEHRSLDWATQGRGGEGVEEAWC